MDIQIKFTDQPFGFDPLNNVYIRALKTKYNVVLSDNPQIVFFSCFGMDFLRYPDSVRIFLANEPVIPNFNDCDYAIGSMELSFGNRYFRQPPLTNYGEDTYWEYLLGARPIPANASERKFCNFVYANDIGGKGAQLRTQFCRRVSQYRHVDCAGRVLNNMDASIPMRYQKGSTWGGFEFNEKWAEEKLSFLQDYKFTIAFENTALEGFTTEKLIHPLLAQSIPIYWGNPHVTEYFNPKAFINCAEYNNDFDAVINRVIELDNDETQYYEMLNQPPLKESFPTDWVDELSAFLSCIIEEGCQPLDKNPIGFKSVSAKDESLLAREGKIGMRSILQSTGKMMKGWLDYKLYKGHGGNKSE